MTSSLPTQRPGDKLKKAIELFSELLTTKPGKTRTELLHEVEKKFDLSPRECDFLNSHFCEEDT